MTAEGPAVCRQECKTGVRRRVKMDGGFNTGRGVTFRYQAKTHPPLSEVVRRKTGGVGAPPKQGLSHPCLPADL